MLNMLGLAKALTDVAIGNYKPKDKPYKVAADCSLPLLIKPAGVKFWILREPYENKENSFSMRRYPDVSLAGAEEKVSGAHMSSHVVVKQVRTMCNNTSSSDDCNMNLSQ